jgi:hypothetical protein
MSVVMRLSILIAVLLVAVRASAQPARPSGADASPCAVTIVRAPDEVRHVIEAWVRNEAACRIALDVRVVPTDGGLYLVARDSAGRLHERIVPDAQAAGVLVASWVANDSVEPLPAAPKLPAFVALPVSPGMSPPIDDSPPSPACGTRGCAVEQRNDRTWAVGVTALPNDVSGVRVRGELDVLHAGPFAVTFAVAGAHTKIVEPANFYSTGPMSTHNRGDLRALVGISATLRQADVSLRLQGAAGLVWVHSFGSVNSNPGNWASAPLEASVVLGYRVSRGWAVGVGPVLTWYLAPKYSNDHTMLGEYDYGMLLELRHGL